MLRIDGVSTAHTAFLDVFARGPIDRPVRIASVAEFERIFGGFHPRSEASYGIPLFFANGGTTAWIVRVAPDAAAARATRGVHDVAGAPPPGRESGHGPGGGTDLLEIRSANPGAWSNALEIGIDHAVTGQGGPGGRKAFNLAVRERRDGRIVQSEVYRDLTNDDPADPRHIATVVEAASGLVVVRSLRAGLPASTHPDVLSVLADAGAPGFVPLTQGTDGVLPGSGGPAARWQEVGPAALLDGLSCFDRIAPAPVDLLCLPVLTTLDDDGYRRVAKAAATFCRDRRAFLILDPPERHVAAVGQWMAGQPDLRSDASALYVPWVTVVDPLNRNQPRPVGASAALAGLYARIDAQRGVWKAPAGTDAVLRAVTGLSLPITDRGSAVLNAEGIDVLRILTGAGVVAWGARTLDGADQRSSDYRYIPVRRTACFIEESLRRGLAPVVLEPNAEPLWSRIRQSAGTFMNNLFLRGAFQGRTPNEAYFVRCDGETTTAGDIAQGIVTVVVGFAPLKPAEFIVLTIRLRGTPP